MSFSPSSFPPFVVGYLLLIFTRYMLCYWRSVPFDWKIKKWHVSFLCLVMGCILSNDLQVSFSPHLSLLPKQFWNGYTKVCFQVKKLMESSLLWVGEGGDFFSFWLCIPPQALNAPNLYRERGKKKVEGDLAQQLSAWQKGQERFNGRKLRYWKEWDYRKS